MFKVFFDTAKDFLASAWVIGNHGQHLFYFYFSCERSRSNSEFMEVNIRTRFCKDWNMYGHLYRRAWALFDLMYIAYVHMSYFLKLGCKFEKCSWRAYYKFWLSPSQNAYKWPAANFCTIFSIINNKRYEAKIWRWFKWFSNIDTCIFLSRQIFGRNLATQTNFKAFA